MNQQFPLRGRAVTRCEGFTLAELMITIAVIGILTTVAIPSFQQSIVSARLSSSSATLYASLSQARAEAIQRNATVQFCANSAAANTGDTLGTACGTSTGSAFVLNADGSTTKVVTGPVFPPGVTVSTNANPVMPVRFYGQGVGYQIASNVPYTGLVAGLYASGISSNNLRCMYLTTGRVISNCRSTSTSGTCPTNEPTQCVTN